MNFHYKRPLPKAPPKKQNSINRHKRKSITTISTDAPKKVALRMKHEDKTKKKQTKTIQIEKSEEEM